MRTKIQFAVKDDSKSFTSWTTLSTVPLTEKDWFGNMPRSLQKLIHTDFVGENLKPFSVTRPCEPFTHTRRRLPRHGMDHHWMQKAQSSTYNEAAQPGQRDFQIEAIFA